MRVVIGGGGVIGTSLAYFLSRRGVEVVVVERFAIACAASGKSGGFLALDWCDGTPLEALARRSFALHASLAAELGNTWGYRRVTTYAGTRGMGSRKDGRDPYLPWLSRDVAIERQLGGPDTTAQVDPGAFTRAMMQAAEANGATHRIATVSGVRRDPSGTRAVGVETDDGVIEGDAVILAMGPWSILAAQWLPMPAVYGLKGHSVVLDTGDAVPAEALFLEYRESTGALLSPEVFPRVDGTTYVCAISSESPLPVDPAAVAPDPGAINRLRDVCGTIAPVFGTAHVLAAQACFRPVSQDGLPLIGSLSGLANAYVATAHSVWGILNAPATGEALAELIVDGAARTVDLSPFDPTRLRPLDPSRLSLA